MRILGRTSLALVGPVVAACLGGCAHATPIGVLLGVDPTVAVTFTSLTPSLLRGGIQDDGNAKDVSVKYRVAFKPSAGNVLPGLRKRLRMQGKADGSQASYATEIAVSGSITSEVRVAADGLTGFVDGQTLGFLERRFLEPGGADLRLEAVWDAGIDGFAVIARVNGAPTGGTLHFPSAREVRLVLDQPAGQAGVTFQAQQFLTPNVGPGDGGPLLDLAEYVLGGADLTSSFGIGVSGLDPKAALWFAQFLMKLGPDAATGPVETQATAQLLNGYLAFLQGTDITAADRPHDLLALRDLAAQAEASLDGGGNPAWQVLDDAVGAGTLLPTTKAAPVVKKIKAALAAATKAKARLDDLIAAGATSGHPVKELFHAGRNSLGVAIALLNGFMSSSPAALEKTVEVEITL